MSKKNQITIPRRTDRTVRVNINSGVESLEGWTPYLTVKLSNKSTSETFICEGIVDGLTMIFYITSSDSNIKDDTYQYDVVIEKDGVRKPIVTSDFVVELWPSSIVEV